MAIAILQGKQHKAMANRHECNECVNENAPQRLHSNIQGSDAITALFRLHKGIYQRESCIIQGCVHCKKVHKKQQTITRCFRKSYTKVATKKRRTYAQTRHSSQYTSIVTKVPRAVYKDKQDIKQAILWPN